SELRAHVVELDARVLDDVVQAGGGERGLVELKAGEKPGDAPRVVDELLPRASYLIGVRASGEVERAGQQLPVCVGLVRLDLGEQLLDEVLMTLQDCHELSVPLPFRGTRNRSRGFDVPPMNLPGPC